MPWDHSISQGPDMKIGWQTPWDKGYVWALDKNSGKERYKAMRGMSRISHLTPAVVEVGGKPQLISAAGDVINAFDPQNGESLWWVYNGGEGTTPSPVIGDGMIFSSSGFPTAVEGGAAIRAFKLGGKGDVTRKNLVWEQKKGVPMLPSLLFHDHLLYTIKESGGIVQCMDAKDGKIIYTERLDGNYSASPVYADGKIYFLSEEGTCTVIDAGREFKEIARSELNETCQASIAISDGRLFIRTQKNLYCIGGEKQAVLQ